MIRALSISMYLCIEHSCFHSTSSFSMAFYLEGAQNCTKTLMRAISGWIPRHLVGAVLVSLPAVAVFSNVRCDNPLSIQVDSDF